MAFDKASAAGGSDADVASFASHAPKVENHVHLDGSWDLDYLFYLIKNVVKADSLPEHVLTPITNTQLPLRGVVEKLQADTAATPGDLRPHVTCAGDCETLPRFLEPFVFFEQIVSRSIQVDIKHLEELAFRFAKRQKESNVLYTEVRYSPQLLLTPEEREASSPERYLRCRAMVDAVSRGLSRGEKAFQVDIRQILCCITFFPDWAPEIERLAEECGEVVAVDVAASELHFGHAALGPPHCRALNGAFGKGKCVTLHAGEEGPAENVLRAVRDYSAIRIGHGYHFLDDHERVGAEVDGILRNCSRRSSKSLHFEECPSSSWFTGGFSRQKPWTEHPLRILYEQGRSVGINTDDPSVMNIDLNHEYVLALSKMGLRKVDLFRISCQQVDACFCSEETKRKLKQALTEFYEEAGVSEVAAKRRKQS